MFSNIDNTLENTKQTHNKQTRRHAEEKKDNLLTQLQQAQTTILEEETTQRTSKEPIQDGSKWEMTYGHDTVQTMDEYVRN